MRISVLDIKRITSGDRDGPSRSDAISGAMSLIDAACQSVPAPDLILVPAGCDHVCSAGHVLTLAMSETYCASLSLKARDWGICIASVVLVLDDDGGDRSVAVLIDANGDTVLRNDAVYSQDITTMGRQWFGTCVLGFVGDVPPQGAVDAEMVSDADESPASAVLLFEKPDDRRSVDAREASCRAWSERVGCMAIVIPAFPRSGHEDVMVSHPLVRSEMVKHEAGVVCTICIERGESVKGGDLAAP